MPLPLDTEAVAFAAGVELTTAVAGVARAIDIGLVSEVLVAVDDVGVTLVAGVG